MWGRRYLALAAIAFGVLAALLDLHGNLFFLYEALAVSLLMAISLIGESRFRDRQRGSPR